MIVTGLSELMYEVNEGPSSVCATIEVAAAPVVRNTFVYIVTPTLNSGANMHYWWYMLHNSILHDQIKIHD